MTEHLHSVLTPGCYRCELNRDEIAALEAEPGDGRVHLMDEFALDACGEAEPGRLEVAPESTPERITCPACRELLGLDRCPEYGCACGGAEEHGDERVPGLDAGPREHRS